MKKLSPDEYSFFPKTWVLPTDLHLVLEEFRISISGTRVLGFQIKKSRGFQQQNPVMIVKPHASSQGKGIFLVTHPSEIPRDKPYVVQEYLNK